MNAPLLRRLSLLSPSRAWRVSTAVLLLPQIMAAEPPARPDTNPPSIRRPVTLESAPATQGPSTTESAVSLRPPRLDLNRPNQESADARIRINPSTNSVERSGSILRHLQARPSWRAALDLFDPLAPVPAEMRRVSYAIDETRPTDHSLPRSLRDRATPETPRVFNDPITHEPMLRLW